MCQLAGTHNCKCKKAFLNFFSFKILACEYVLALEKLFEQSIYKNPRLFISCLNDYKCISHFWFKSEFWNPEPVMKFRARSIKPVYRYWKKKRIAIRYFCPRTAIPWNTDIIAQAYHKITYTSNIGHSHFWNDLVLNFALFAWNESNGLIRIMIFTLITYADETRVFR